MKRIEEECQNDPELNVIKDDAIKETEEKPKKKKNKKKKEDGPSKEQITEEVQEELGDLLSSMNIGGGNKK